MKVLKFIIFIFPLLIVGCQGTNYIISDGIKPLDLIIQGDTAYYANDTSAISILHKMIRDTSKQKEVNKDSVLSEPKFIKSVIPKYPQELYPITGSTIVKLWVGKQGKPRIAIITKSTNSLFNERSLIAAMQCEFSPAVMTKGPISVWISFPYYFKSNH